MLKTIYKKRNIPFGQQTKNIYMFVIAKFKIGSLISNVCVMKNGAFIQPRYKNVFIGL